MSISVGLCYVNSRSQLFSKKYANSRKLSAELEAPAHPWVLWDPSSAAPAPQLGLAAWVLSKEQREVVLLRPLLACSEGTVSVNSVLRASEDGAGHPVCLTRRQYS